MRKELIDRPIRIFQWEGLWQPSRRLQWQKVWCTQKCQCRQKKARNAAGYQAAGERARAVNQSGATGGPRDELNGQQKLSGESTGGWEFKRQYSMNHENTKVMSLCSSRAGLSFPALLEVTFFFKGPFPRSKVNWEKENMKCMHPAITRHIIMFPLAWTVNTYHFVCEKGSEYK